MYRKNIKLLTILGSSFYSPFKFFIILFRDILFYANYDLKYKLKQGLTILHKNSTLENIGY